MLLLACIDSLLVFAFSVFFKKKKQKKQKKLKKTKKNKKKKLFIYLFLLLSKYHTWR
jgi:hypothetical protein